MKTLSINRIINVLVFCLISTSLTSQVTFNLIVFLEGPFNGTGLNTDLNDMNLIPFEQPYNVAPWNYNGTEQVASIPDQEIVDWVLVELRETSGSASGAIPASMIHKQAAFINSYGNIVGLDGTSMITYAGTITENLYVLIWHRNHLAIMSSGPLSDAGGIYSWDFTIMQSNAYGGGQKYIGGGEYGMRGGDCNSSGTINNVDKIARWDNKAGEAGYFLGDLNLDGQVNNLDKDDIWNPNIGIEVQLPEGVVFHCGLELLDERNNTIYNTVKIGSQCWMAENLNLGIRIDDIIPPTNNDTIEKYCYNNHEYLCDTYGGIYQWDELMNYTTDEGAQGICPDDWHVPAFWEWTQLINFLGGTSVAGGKMKEEGTEHWDFPNVGATNSSGFTGLPGGVWNPNGYYDAIGEQGYFWTSTETITGQAWDVAIQSWGTQVVQYNPVHAWGLSVRCIRD